MVKKRSSDDFTSDNILLTSLKKFFKIKTNLNSFLRIYNKKSKISLRLLDWFVTNYSKKHNISYFIKKRNARKYFLVYEEYKSQLKAYSKKRFDPFCRRHRITFTISKDEEIITTIGQLNFFKWAIENKVLNYVTKHLEKVETDMNVSIKTHYKKKNTKTRKPLSICATKQIRKHNVKIIVNFD